MRALLLCGYDASSHAAWRRGLRRALPRFEWSERAQPARHFAWRARANPLRWALGAGRDALQGPWDLIVCCGAVDLAALRGLHPSVARAPCLAYFHEHQFAYPFREAARPNAIHLQLTNLTTALAADRIAFNSAWARRSFLDGARALARRAPDGVPPEMLTDLERRSIVLPAGLDDDAFLPAPTRSGPVRIVWNHRWEYDKGPERAFDALRELARRRAPFELVVCGRRFRRAPACFARAREELADHIVHWGTFAERSAYLDALGRADIALSTALHEFQGLALCEAIARGARAIAPDRLAYPEYVPDAWRYPSTPDDAEAEARAVADRLERAIARAPDWRGEPTAQYVEQLRWTRLAARYEAWLGGAIR